MQIVHHQLAEALELDKRILETHALLSRAERDLALLLAELVDTKHFLDLGYANVGQYAQAKLQLEPRKTRGLVRIGRALPDLPELDQAFASGALCWTKARELSTVIAPQTEAEWVGLACRSTSRELERVVAAHRPGEPPSGDEVKEAGPVRLSFSMEPVEAEQVRAALAAIRAAAGVSRDEVGDGALLAQLAARVNFDLESTEAPTGERFRIVIEHCPRCGQASTPDAEVSETHVGQACCDAEILEMREGSTRGHVSRTIPPATRRAVLQRDRHRCQIPGCSNRLWLDIHHLDYRRDGGGHSEGNLLTLCCTQSSAGPRRAARHRTGSRRIGVPVRRRQGGARDPRGRSRARWCSGEGASRWRGDKMPRSGQNGTSRGPVPRSSRETPWAGRLRCCPTSIPSSRGGQAWGSSRANGSS